MKNLKRNNELGFTLIEVLVALSIFAIGILAVVSMQVMAVEENTLSRRMTEGSHLALGKMEELSGLDYTDSNLNAGSHELIQDDYRMTWDVTDNEPLSDTKKIEITVQWNEKGTNKRVVLTSFKHDKI